MTEKYGNMFNFDPALYSVTGTTTTGFTVNNAGFVIAGNNKEKPTAGVSDSTLTGRQWGISPRVGFAWSPFAITATSSFAVAAACTTTAASTSSISRSLPAPDTAVLSASPNPHRSATVRHRRRAVRLRIPSAPLSVPPGARYVAPSSNPANINTGPSKYAQRAHRAPAAGYDRQFGPNCGGVQNQEGLHRSAPTPSTSAPTPAATFFPTPSTTLSTCSGSPTNDIAIDIGYVGNRGRHAVVPVPFNTPGIATSTNPIWGETAAMVSKSSTRTTCGDSNCDYSSHRRRAVEHGRWRQH